jgi:hypothetical protein
MGSRRFVSIRSSYAITHAKPIFPKWRHDVIRCFQRGIGERIPVMMVGLKRDLRKEGEGIIYPQEVSYKMPSRAACGRQWRVRRLIDAGIPHCARATL